MLHEMVESDIKETQILSSNLYPIIYCKRLTITMQFAILVLNFGGFTIYVLYSVRQSGTFSMQIRVHPLEGV